MAKTVSLRIFSALIVAFTLSACAGTKQIKAPAAPLPSDPAAAVARLEGRIGEGRAQNLNVLSPTWFARAEGSLAEAKRALETKGEISRINSSVSKGLTEIAQAEEIGRIVCTAIPQAIEARKLAREAGATVFGDEYAAVEKRFLGLAKDVETNDLKGARADEPGVVEAFHGLEVRAIKETILGDARKVLAQAESQGAKKWVPGPYAEAQRELAGAEEFIATNPYAREEMQERGSAALFKANRALQLNRQALRLRDMDPEGTALWVENILKQSSEALGAPDMRDRTFDVQVGNILGSIDSLVKDRDFLVQKTTSQQAAMDDLQTRCAEQIESLQRANRQEAAAVAKVLTEQEAEKLRLEAQRRKAEERLESERRFNELYDQVQALFTPQEAECYKQGSRMVIRLRGMTFPVGQAVIMPENYPLLSKVQQAVRTFTEPKVTIEGHTDSTGSAELNDHLSQQRAESVRQYLLANKVVREDHIGAAGFGSSRPLAPNTTPEGRAANRRIDVVITPRGMPQN